MAYVMIEHPIFLRIVHNNEHTARSGPGWFLEKKKKKKEWFRKPGMGS